MACGSCASGGGCSPAGCQNNGSCSSGGCNKLNVYDWLSDMELPSHFRPFDVVEVRFKGSRKDFYRNVNNLPLETGDAVVVESTSGHDIGFVSLKGELVKLHLKKHNTSADDPAIRKIYRKANEKDMEKYNEAKTLEVATMYKARTIALQLSLKMKLSDVEYQGDRTKATFYYTAEERVDFRELIKRLAEEFRVRIEMRQISLREEASRLGGIGSCGRELCCSTWFTDFKVVNLGAARYQNLSINQLKLSGQCGKLKCCLNYELDTYLEALQEFPDNHENLVLETEAGRARLLKTDILKRIMWFSYEGVIGGDWIPLTVDKARDIQQLNQQGNKPADLGKPANTQPARMSRLLEEDTLHDFENVVGQDSITRMDTPKKKKKKSGGASNRTRPGNNRERGSNQGQQGSADGFKPKEPRKEGPDNAGNNRRDNRPQGPREPREPREPRNNAPQEGGQPQERRNNRNRPPRRNNQNRNNNNPNTPPPSGPSQE